MIITPYFFQDALSGFSSKYSIVQTAAATRNVREPNGSKSLEYILSAKIWIIIAKNHKPNAKKPLYLLIQSIRKLNQLTNPIVGFFVCGMVRKFYSEKNN